MECSIQRELKNDKGFTLLELVVSIALLALIVGALLSAFTFSTKTNIKSSAIVDEGYLAQEWMEKIYDLSKTKTLTELADALLAEGFPYFEWGVPADYYTFQADKDGYHVYITIKLKEYIDYDILKYVLVEIYEDDTLNNKMAMLQNIISIKE